MVLLENKLLTQQSSFIPYCERRTNNNRSHLWFINEIKRSLQVRNRLHKQIKAQNSPENIRLYNKSRKRAKALTKQVKRHDEKVLQQKANIMKKCFYRYFNSRKNIRTEIGPLKDNVSNLVIDDQSMAMMMNKYFRLVFNTTSSDDDITLYLH